MTVESKNIINSKEAKSVLGEIKKSIITARTFGSYCELLGYSGQRMKNKAILDVGSGLSTFAEQARTAGAKIIKLDGAYSTKGVLLSAEEKENAITAAAQYLPFKDNVFDETVSLYCLYYIETRIDKAIQEMIRVTKPEGKIRIHPVHNIGFTYIIEKEPTLSMIEMSAANTVIITKNPSYSGAHWAKLATDIASLLAFRELH